MLTCTDSTRVTTQTKWMQGLVKKMVRVEFQRALTAENKREGSGDHSCEPICLSMIKDIVKQYSVSKYNPKESALRNFVTESGFYACGRCSEASFVQWSGLTWDLMLNTVVAAVPQMKVSKIKAIVFPPGRDRHTCWFHSLAVYVHYHPECTQAMSDDVDWLFPVLQSVGKPGQKISRYLKVCACCHVFCVCVCVCVCNYIFVNMFR